MLIRGCNELLVWKVFARATMPTYHVYTLNAQRHITQPLRIIQAEDDQAAIQQAKALSDGRDVEIWQESRCVIDLSGDTRR
jgi:hypothetical protein